MNKLYVGFSREVELPSGGCLLIDDEIRDVKEWRHPRVFDPLKHSFNPLAGIDEKKAQEIAELLYTVYPQGENTLTVRNGKWKLAPAILQADRLDKVTGDEEVRGLIGDLLFLPTVRRVLCNKPNFTFKVNSVNMARINRAELGERAALTLGLLLMSSFKGQIVIPDFGFYGRDAHASLIREDRLVAGVNFLAELSPKLRNSVLLIKEKVGQGATFDDAETLAGYAGLARGTNGYNDFVQQGMGLGNA